PPLRVTVLRLLSRASSRERLMGRQRHKIKIARQDLIGEGPTGLVFEPSGSHCPYASLSLCFLQKEVCARTRAVLGSAVNGERAAQVQRALTHAREAQMPICRQRALLRVKTLAIIAHLQEHVLGCEGESH